MIRVLCAHNKFEDVLCKYATAPPNDKWLIVLEVVDTRYMNIFTIASLKDLSNPLLYR